MTNLLTFKISTVAVGSNLQKNSELFSQKKIKNKNKYKKIKSQSVLGGLN